MLRGSGGEGNPSGVEESGTHLVVGEQVDQTAKGEEKGGMFGYIPPSACFYLSLTSVVAFR